MKLTYDEYDELTSLRAAAHVSLEAAEENEKDIAKLRTDLESVGLKGISDRLGIIARCNRTPASNLKYVVLGLDKFREEHK